jgi:hypothetical protein
VTDRLGEHTTQSEDDSQRVARPVREACITAAHDGYGRAGLAGLWAEGCLEMVIDAIRALASDAIFDCAD